MTYIYAIKNLLNNKVYIGSTKSFKSRRADHFWRLKSNTHHSNHLQNSYNKYGKDKFAFYIIEECEDSIRKEREIFHITLNKSDNRDFGYNVWEVNSDNFKSSEQTKEKQLLAYMKKNKTIEIDVYNINTVTLIGTYRSIGECSRFLKIHASTISEALNGKRKSFKGLYFSKKGEGFNYIPSSMQRNMSIFHKKISI